jgi:hypothetical protein
MLQENRSSHHHQHHHDVAGGLWISADFFLLCRVSGMPDYKVTRRDKSL